MTERIYRYKDVDMLMAAQTILKSMSTNQSELSMARTTWTPEYIGELQGRISLSIDDHLGLDKLKELRVATDLVKSIYAPAVKNLSLLKTQIEVDFGSDSVEILKSLGCFRSLNRLDQEDLILVLYALKKGMTPELKAEIIAKGTNPVLIETIIDYASQLEQANLNQESLKMTVPQLSDTVVTSFNSIYQEVIGICKIAKKIYFNDPLKKDQFTFSKVVKRMGAATQQGASVAE